MVSAAIRSGRTGFALAVLIGLGAGGAARLLRAADLVPGTNLVSAQVDTNVPALVGTNALSDGSTSSVTTNEPSGLASGITNAPGDQAAQTNATDAVRTNLVRAESLPGFQVRPGFRLELVASEPMVVAPYAMAFDENGRLYVAEMRDYPDRRDNTPHLGRVKLLEAQDEKGVFKSSTILAEDLPLPSAIACYSGGIFVAATPEIIFLKDTRGTGVADVRRIVFNGLGGTNAVSAEAVLNSFQWGLDNRIHVSTAGVGGFANPVGIGVSGVQVWGSDFSFDPRTLTVVRETGPSQSGVCFDGAGRKYLCNLQRPLYMPLLEPRYLERNGFFARPLDTIDVLSPATPVLRLAPVSPPRTPAPGGTNASPAATTQLVSGWLTNARSPAIYTGNAFPAFQNNVFIPDAEAHAIHRAVLQEAGLGVLGSRAPEDRSWEFVASTDPLFRPVQVINAPDGALYIADLREGGDSGRIYRLVPEGFRQPKPPQLGQAKTYDIVAALAHPNGWHRNTAARLLYERRDPAAASLLANMLAGSRLPLARLHALRSLEGMGVLTEQLVLRALRDVDEHVRENAVRLSERMVTNAFISDTLWAQLRGMSADPSPRVRCQLALTMGELRRSGRAAVLAQVLARDTANPWVQAAVLSSLGDLRSAWLPNAMGGGAVDLLSGLASEPAFRNSPAGLAFMQRLATMIGTKGSQLEVAQMINFLDQSQLELPVAMSLVASFGEGLHLTRSGLALVDRENRLRRFYTEAHNVALNDTLPEPVRVAAIRLIGVSPFGFTEISDLMLLYGTGQSPAVQTAVVATLSRFADPRIVTNLVARWHLLPAGLRRETLDHLLRRPERVGPLIEAMESGTVPPADLSPQQANYLRTFGQDAELAARAVRLLGPGEVQRPAAVERFRPALRFNGVPQRGRTVFLSRCASCHRLGSDGARFGPDLEGARVYGKERLLTAIIEPHAQIRSGFESYVVNTHSGDTLIGVPGGESAPSLTLRQPRGEAVVFSRAAVQDTVPQPWSIMPAGLEQGMTPQDMADLLAWIMSAPRTPQ